MNSERLAKFLAEGGTGEPGEAGTLPGSPVPARDETGAPTGTPVIEFQVGERDPQPGDAVLTDTSY